MNNTTRTLCVGSTRVQPSRFPAIQKEYGWTSNGGVSTPSNGLHNREAFAYAEWSTNTLRIINTLIANPELVVYSIFPSKDRIDSNPSATYISYPTVLQNVNAGGSRVLKVIKDFRLLDYSSYSASLPWPTDLNTTVELEVELVRWSRGTVTRFLHLCLPGLRHNTSREDPFLNRNYNTHGFNVDGSGRSIYVPGFGGPSSTRESPDARFIPLRSLVNFTLETFDGAPSDPSIRIKMPLSAFYNGMFVFLTSAVDAALPAVGITTPCVNWRMSVHGD